MNSLTRVLLPEVWGWICRRLSIWSCLQLSATDKHTMGRLVAAGVLDAVDRMVTVGRQPWPIGIRVKRCKWFDREYITRIVTVGSNIAVKSIECESAQVLIMSIDGGHQYIYAAGGKMKHLVIPTEDFGRIRSFLVLTAIESEISIYDFIRKWMNGSSGPDKESFMKVDDELGCLLNVFYQQSGVPAQRGIPIPNRLLKRPDVVALLSPK